MNKIKDITTVAGFIRCGHVAIRAHGLTHVSAPKNCKSGRLLELRTALCPIDRCVSAQEFSNLTGLHVQRGASEIVKPMRKARSRRLAVHVASFIKP